MSTVEPMPRTPPPCGECEYPLTWSDRLSGWYCTQCDGSEALALDAADEARREAADREYEAHPPGCTCVAFGDYQCDVHGPAVIAAQRAEFEQHEREQGRGRRGPYWRPPEARVRLTTTACTPACHPAPAAHRAFRHRGWWLAAALACRANDPLAHRAAGFLLENTPRTHHAVVLAHLHERVALPGGA